MIGRAIPFSGKETAKWLQRRVRLIEAFGPWYAGMTGTVVARYPFMGGYMLEVEWDSLSFNRTLRFEYFTKDVFDSHVIEC